MVFWRFFNEKKKKKKKKRRERGKQIKRIARDGQRCVDARGGNSHETGGTRLAVLKLRPSPDWPCTRRGLVIVLLLENWRGAEFPKPSREGFLRSMASLFSLSRLSPLFPLFSSLRHRRSSLAKRINSTLDFLIDR